MKPMSGRRKRALAVAGAITALFVVGWLAIAGGLPTGFVRPIADLTGTAGSATQSTGRQANDAFSSQPTLPPSTAQSQPSQVEHRHNDGDHHGWPADHHDGHPDDDDDH